MAAHNESRVRRKSSNISDYISSSGTSCGRLKVKLFKNYKNNHEHTE